jgi:hypothetical protein
MALWSVQSTVLLPLVELCPQSSGSDCNIYIGFGRCYILFSSFYSNTVAHRFLNMYTDRSGKDLSQGEEQIYSLNLVR